MSSFLTVLMNIVQAIWIFLSDLQQKVGDEASDKYKKFIKKARKLIKYALKILGACLAFFVFGFMINNDGFVVFAGIVSSIITLVAWVAGDSILRAAGVVAEAMPGVGEKLNEATIEMRKLLKPLATISLSLSAFSVAVVLIGVQAISFGEVGTWFSLALFFSIVGVYFGYEGKMFGQVLVGLIIFLLITTYWFPKPSKAIFRWLGAESQEAISAVNRETVESRLNAQGTYRFVKYNTECKGRKLKKGTQAIIIGPKPDDQELTSSTGYGGDANIAVRFLEDNDVFSIGIYGCPARIFKEQVTLADLPAPPSPEREVKSELVVFDAGEVVVTKLVGRVGDEIVYGNPTASILSPDGEGKDAHMITSTITYNVTRNGKMVVIGGDRPGQVTVTLLPGN